MNCFLTLDNNWNDYSIVNKRLKTIQINTRINVNYSSHLKEISRICSENVSHIIRRSLERNNEFYSILNILKYIDFCIVFTNEIEYNNISRIIIDLCYLNKINCFVFRENGDFIFNGEKSDFKFNKILKTLEKSEFPLELIYEMKYKCETSFIKPIKPIEDIILDIKGCYKKIEDTKETSKIKKINDKRIIKEYSYMEYMTQKQKWIKDMKST